MKNSPNIRRVKKEWHDYKEEVRNIIVPDLRDASISRIPHKLHAFIEEFFDKAPRIASYLFWPVVIGLYLV